jgi:hypothetical protein
VRELWRGMTLKNQYKNKSAAAENITTAKIFRLIAKIFCSTAITNDLP